MFKLGTRFKANTHKDFLNQYFGKNYDGYSRCSCHLIDIYYIWMIRFDESNNGYTNKINYDAIKEYFSESEYKYKNNIKNKVFLVFKIIDNKKGREYEYMGVFKYVDTIEKYNLYKREDNYNINLIPFYYPSFDVEFNKYVAYIQYDFYRKDLIEGPFISLEELNISSYIFDNMRLIIMKQLHEKEIESNEIFMNIDKLEDMLDKESIKYYYDENDDYWNTKMSLKQSIFEFSQNTTNQFIKMMEE
ncbi:MAG: hypothetical protein IJS83_07175 [Acholeplasmatales bacterium]|nr:hypothetical protein [Acholeplasmatales bacterium]